MFYISCLELGFSNVQHVIHFESFPLVRHFDALSFVGPSPRSLGRFGAPDHARFSHQARIHADL